MALVRRGAAQQGDEFLVPDEDDRLIAWLDKKREQARSTLPDYQMRLNLSYFLGQQWVIWDPSNRVLRRPTDRPDDPTAPVRITINKVGEIVEQAVAELIQRRPVPEARPVSDEDTDLDAARVGTRILRHELERACWEEVLLDLGFWVVPIGWSFLQVTWNPDAGPVVGELADEDDEGAQPEAITRGEIEIEDVPAWELGIDPNAKKARKAWWACRTVSMTKEAIWDKWGVVPEGAESGRTLMDDVQKVADASWDMREQDRSDCYAVHQFWLRPGSRAKPDGLVVTWCGKSILEAPKPFPYEHGQLPFIQWNLLPGVGRLEGRTWVDDLLSMQNDYNNARSAEATIRRTLTPKVYAPAGSIDPKRVRARVEVIPYNPVGEKPFTDLPDGRWMAQYQAGMNRSDAEMQDRASMHGASKGVAPGRNTPAASIIALQEADDIGFVIPTVGLERMVKDLGHQILMLVRQYWTEERLVRTWSEEGELAVFRYSRANLADQVDVGISAGSDLPRSKAAKAALARELRQQFPQDVDLPTYLRMLEMPGLDFVVQRIDADVKQARRHIEGMYAACVELTQQGAAANAYAEAMVPVETWHNHYIHLREFGEFMKTQEWEDLPQEGRDIFRARYEIHMQQAQPQLQSVLPPGTPTEEELRNPRKPPGRSPTISQLGGMSGAGMPGRSPLVSADQQAKAMGT